MTIYCISCGAANNYTSFKPVTCYKCSNPFNINVSRSEEGSKLNVSSGFEVISEQSKPNIEDGRRLLRKLNITPISDDEYEETGGSSSFKLNDIMRNPDLIKE